VPIKERSRTIPPQKIPIQRMLHEVKLWFVLALLAMVTGVQT
jgi:hypothetical protein